MPVTLYAKALDYGSPHPILNDERAHQIVEDPCELEITGRPLCRPVRHGGVR
jgi:O-methyltransferase involved in polyketide biosynthesis